MRSIRLGCKTVEVLADMAGFGRRIGEGNGAIEGLPGGIVLSELSQQATLHAMKVEIAIELFGQGGDQLQGGGWAAPFADGDGAVERHDWRGLQHLKRLIETVDGGPVGVFGAFGARMLGGNGRLDLIDARLPVAQGFFDKSTPLHEHGVVPKAAILIFEQYKLAVSVETRAVAGMRRRRLRSTSVRILIAFVRSSIACEPVVLPEPDRPWVTTSVGSGGQASACATSR